MARYWFWVDSIFTIQGKNDSKNIALMSGNQPRSHPVTILSTLRDISLVFLQFFSSFYVNGSILILGR